MEYEEIYKSYLKKLKIEVPEKMEEMEAVFLLARKDYLDYQISVDQLSTICETLHNFARKDISILTSNFESVLVAGMELSWYIRNTNDADHKQLLYFLESIHKYKKK